MIAKLLEEKPNEIGLRIDGDLSRVGGF